MQTIIDIATDHPHKLKEQMYLYLASVGPAADALQKYSDPTNRCRADGVYDTLQDIITRYKRVIRACGLILGQKDKNELSSPRVGNDYALPDDKIAEMKRSIKTWLFGSSRSDLHFIVDEIINEQELQSLPSNEAAMKRIENLKWLCEKYVQRLDKEQWEKYALDKCEYHNNHLWNVAKMLSAKFINTTLYLKAEKKNEEINKFFDSLENLKRNSSSRMSEIVKEVKDEYKKLFSLIHGDHKRIVIDFASAANGTMEFWNFVQEEFALEVPHLLEVARAVLNVPPVVSSVDTFFSVAGCLTDKHRLTSHGHVVTQAVLHCNGDYSQKNPLLPWSFCDARKACDREQELAKRGEQSPFSPKHKRVRRSQ